MRSAATNSVTLAALALLLAGAAHAGSSHGYARIKAGTVTGTPGARLRIDVTLHTDLDVAGTGNVLVYSPETRILARENGRPACSGGDELPRPTGLSFGFSPSGCSSAINCTAVVALVLNVGNPRPIADGTVLYSCELEIAADASPGLHALMVREAEAADFNGTTLPATGVDGAVIVEGATPGVVVSVCYSEFPGSSCSGTEAPFHHPVLVGPAPLTDSRAATEFNGESYQFVDIEPGDYVIPGDGCNPFGCFVDTPVTVGTEDVFVQVRQVGNATATSSPSPTFTPEPTGTATRPTDAADSSGCQVGPTRGGRWSLVFGGVFLWFASSRLRTRLTSRCSRHGPAARAADRWR